MRNLLLSLKQMGVWMILLSFTSFLLILVYEKTNPTEMSLSIRIIGLLSYSVFSSIIIYFATHTLPIVIRQAKLHSYLASKAYRIHINTSTVILTLLSIAKDKEPNRRNRSNEEWSYICLKTSPYEKISGGFFQREDFDDFYHYYQEVCLQLKSICNDLLNFSALFNERQIELIAQIDSIVSMSSFLNKGVKVGSIKGPNSIPEAYGHRLRTLFNSSKDLYESFGKFRLVQ